MRKHTPYSSKSLISPSTVHEQKIDFYCLLMKPRQVEMIWLFSSDKVICSIVNVKSFWALGWLNFLYMWRGRWKVVTKEILRVVRRRRQRWVGRVALYALFTSQYLIEFVGRRNRNYCDVHFMLRHQLYLRPSCNAIP